MKHKYLKSLPNSKSITNKEILELNGEFNRCLSKRLSYSKKYNLSIQNMKELMNRLSKRPDNSSK